MNFQLTGNPFVDTGLYVLAYLAKVEDPEQLTIEKVRDVYGDGRELARINARLKSFTMVFGSNSPLTQSQYRPKGRQKILSEKNINAYSGVLSGLLQTVERTSAGYPLCEICGDGHGFEFNQVVHEGLTKAGISDERIRHVGREWFPLAGSLGNDAQSLPSASRSLVVCAKCLFAVHYVPLGVMLMRGNLVCFQSNYSRIAAELTEEIASDYEDVLRTTKDKVDMLGKKEVTTAVTRRILGWMKKVQEVKQEETLLDSVTLTVWLFKNSGKEAVCDIVEIPNRGLQFLWQARKQGCERDLLALLTGERKEPEYQLLTCIQQRRDYFRLYPYKTFPGASPKLFALYHQLILGESAGALKSAQRLAQARLGQATPKEQKTLKKAGMLEKNPIEYGRFRKLILDMAKGGQFDLASYNLLFPEYQRHPIRVERRGWRTVEYYLSHPDAEIPDFSPSGSHEGEGMKPHPKIKQMARLYFDDYLARKGIESLERNIIDGFQRTNPNGVQWLRDVYLRLAKDCPGFTLEDWDEFVQDENGQPQAYELLFQMRLELANLYREYVQGKN